jgi:arginine-tRNA-protein transferase
VNKYRPNRSQSRSQQKNQNCTTHLLKAGFKDEHFQLYQRYVNVRHADGNMANPLPEDYQQFLYSDWSDTIFIEIRENTRLLAVAVCDRVNTGLSAVYSFFEPDLPKRGLGTYCILTMIAQTRRLGLEYLYLGYLIHGSDKMKYKQYFQPLETFKENQWQFYHRGATSAAQ